MATASAGLGCYEIATHLSESGHEKARRSGQRRNRGLAPSALANVGQFDQAMGCWERVKKSIPNNEEAQSASPGCIPTKSPGSAAARKTPRTPKKTAGGKDGTRETELRAKHEADPADVDSASDLSDLLAREERYAEAEEVLKTSLAASGGD